MINFNTLKLSILDEIETIVNSGTKINIDYYLEDIMDEEDIEEIVDYFKDSESDDLKSAMEELGDVYSEDEIRMVRIKFMSEMGIQLNTKEHIMLFCIIK